MFWRTVSRDNVTTWYGRTAESRIADPADAGRVFQWLVCEIHDDRGNAVDVRVRRRRRPPGASTGNVRGGEPLERGPGHEPLPEGHPLRQHEALPGHAGAGRDELARTGRRRGPGVDVRASSSTTAITRDDAPTPRARPALGRTRGPVLDAPRRLRAAHLPALPARADVPRLPGRGRRGRRLPGPLDRPRLRGAGGPCAIRAVLATRCCAMVTAALAADRARRATTPASCPPVTFSYSQPASTRRSGSSIPGSSRTCRSAPSGPAYQWIDLDGEGLVRRPRPSRAAPGSMRPTTARGASAPRGRSRGRRRWRR